MDDLEKAILISFDESGNVNSILKSQAVAFCQQIKENPNICSICIECLCHSKLFQVQFWCLQCLQEVLQIRYSSMSLEEKSFIRQSLFSMACLESIGDSNSIRVLEGPAFIRNKLAQVLVTFIYYEYPLIWSSFFVDYLRHLSKGGVVIDMFCRVLNALDDELISLDYPRTSDELSIAMRVKDGMREECISLIAKAWFDIIMMYRNRDQELCISVLDSMRRYISWIDIGLVANDVFVPLLFELVLGNDSSDQLRCAALSCLSAVVIKRMDQKTKLRLLQSLQISRIFCLVGRDNDSDLVSTLAELMTGYASEALDCFKKLKTADHNGIPMELLDEVLPSMFYIMQNSEMEPSSSMVQVLSNYVSAMKSLSILTEKQQLHLGQILEVIRIVIRYDNSYRDNLDRLDKVGREEEDRMVDFRKDLLILLRNVGRVAPNVCQIFIRNALVNAASSSTDTNVEEVEAALSLFYGYGESLTDEAMRNSGIMRDLVTMLLSVRFSSHNNRLVAIVYLETVTRYIKFIQENKEYIPLVLTVFLDERGIHHQNINVSRRAGYLFMKLVKLLKAELVPFIERILQSLQDKVAQFTNINFPSKELSRSEDGSHIFEAIGLLIGMENVPVDKQTDYLAALLTPLCQQVEASLLNANIQNPEDSPTASSNIQQIVMAINALSKGFGERLATARRPGIGLMFKQTLDVLLQILVVYPRTEALRSKVTSFIHRMVDTLGTDVLPYLPKALEQLLAETEPKQMIEFLVLLNQLISKFNISIRSILEEAYPAVASRVLSVLPRDGFPTGPGSNTEEIRELQELQRTFYAFLQVIVTHDLSSVFLSSKSSCFLDPMMQLLLYSCCNHKDISVRKASVQIFVRLIKDWSSGPQGEEKVPGFKKFVIETFATNCCLYSVLDKSFDLQDANTLILFKEIVTAQKVMYDKFGDEFLIHFVSGAFSSAHCPQDLAEQYCQNLQGNDMKALKSFYQSLIEKLRLLQQNGSLDFR